MSWSQALNDVTSRISAASQSLGSLKTNDWNHRSCSSTSSSLADQACRSIYSTSQSASMSLRIQLDQRDRSFYSNLDFVTGRVILSLATDTAISSIKVKLEGESRTRLSGPKFENDPRDRQKTNLEVHKLLYKVQTVFPKAAILENAATVHFTMPAGQYAYPFSIKIPFNNDCISNTTIFTDLKLGPLLGANITNARHVKQTLPPNMNEIAGKAEIKFFVKATLVRPKFYQENVRTVTEIEFRPVEPPRPPPRQEEIYARRQHQFQSITTTTIPKGSKTSLFSKSSKSQSNEQALAIKVEARLPSPTIVTCGSSLPLRLPVDKTNDSPANIVVSLLQIELIGSTFIRAQDLNSVEVGTWVLMSQANMNLALSDSKDESSRSFQVPSRFWENTPVPQGIAPTFQTCNITRSYELEVRVGITHGTADGVRPELVVLPLRLPVEVYSGVPPPQQVLNRLNTQKLSSGPTSNLPRPERSASSQYSPSTPLPASQPARPGNHNAPPPNYPDELPPTYEDAIADDIAPADGLRRDSEPSTPQQWFNPDAKSGSGLNRYPSERLFSQNAPSPPIFNSHVANQQPATTNMQTVITPDTIANSMAELDVVNNNNTPQPQAPPLPARKTDAENADSGKKSK